MPGPSLKPADFPRLLATRPKARSAHFALHHVPAPSGTDPDAGGRQLSTGAEQKLCQAVDKYPGLARSGCAVPKRHARRSVTRNLLRRQMRVALAELPSGRGGLWLIRLTAPWPVSQWPAAASDPLRQAVRSELSQLVRGLT